MVGGRYNRPAAATDTGFSILGRTFDLLIAAGVLRGCAVNITGELQNGTTNHYFLIMNAFEKLHAEILGP